MRTAGRNGGDDVRFSFLYGVRTRDWLRMLGESGFALSRTGIPTALGITALSLHNSWLGRREARIDTSGERVRAPVFVLGHWRSGTTHLQYLLAQDPRMASPTTYDVCWPGSLLTGEGDHGRFMARFLPSTRLQDAMAFGMSVPNEDEIALAVMGLPTPYRYWAFPASGRRWDRYMSFADATERERETFRRGLDLYLRKLQWKYRSRLVLKSPPHTARVPMLLEMYPDARFVHIHRHPIDVYRSTRHLWETYHRRVAFVQEPDVAGVEERILEVYSRMYDAYFENVDRIPPGRHADVRFEDLERDPLGVMGEVYETLGFPDLPEARLRSYMERLGTHRKNRYAPLATTTRRRVERSWARSFDTWKYPRSVSHLH